MRTTMNRITNATFKLRMLLLLFLNYEDYFDTTKITFKFRMLNLNYEYYWKNTNTIFRWIAKITFKLRIQILNYE